MKSKEIFYKMMEESDAIALATSVGNKPNVRIVNFYYDMERRVIVFSSFKKNAKVNEMEVNPHVAFTTIPRVGNGHIKGVGVAVRSKLSIYDCEQAFVKKIPEYDNTIQVAGEQLLVYEIEFKEVLVVESMENIYVLNNME